MSTLFWILGVLAAFVVGWVVGSRTGGRAGAAETVETPSPGEEERKQALREALGRIAAFLRGEVRAPLREAVDAGDQARREGVEHALGALEDLEFFLREPLTPDEVHNLAPVVQQSIREFAQDWEISVRFAAEPEPLQVHIHRETFMDAVYLLLHNAGYFGEEQSIHVQVSRENGEAAVVIRDQGPGFTPEALEHGHDLFFTTTESGLGLGIPFARRIVESCGGSLTFGNHSDGGAEVKLLLPLA